MTLDRDGAELAPGALDRRQLAALTRNLPSSAEAGSRIFSDARLSEWLVRGPIGDAVQAVLGSEAKPVRAILFNKSADSNWALGWHQDRTIAVRDKVVVAGFDHWTSKAGVVHVEPPFAIIEEMMTVRIHLDPVCALNAPLLVAPGSHLLGRIEEASIEATVAQLGVASCLAEAGDIWLYRTAILHASERSSSAGLRRVLQVDFAAQDLPGGMEWLGIA